MSWKALTFFDKLNLFSGWTFVSLIANMCSFTGALFMLINAPYQQTEHFIGFGCMFTWFSITKYFASTREYSMITRTFSIAIPMVIRVMIGAFPLIVAFALAGTCLFWTARGFFDTAHLSLFTLFAIMNGDSVGAIFKGSA